MSHILRPLTEGWTEPIVHRIMNDGEPLSVFGKQVALILAARDGTLIDTSGKVTVIDDGTEPLRGLVSFSPEADDLVADDGAYFWKWELTDTFGKVAFCPSGEAARLKIYPQAV